MSKCFLEAHFLRLYAATAYRLHLYRRGKTRLSMTHPLLCLRTCHEAAKGAVNAAFTYTHVTHLLLRVWHPNKVLIRLWQQGLDWSSSSRTHLPASERKCCKTCTPLNTSSTSVSSACRTTELSAVIPAQVWMSLFFSFILFVFIFFPSVTRIFHHVRFLGLFAFTWCVNNKLY